MIWSRTHEQKKAAADIASALATLLNQTPSPQEVGMYEDREGVWVCGNQWIPLYGPGWNEDAPPLVRDWRVLMNMGVFDFAFLENPTISEELAG